VNNHHRRREKLPVLAAFGFLGLLGGALAWVLSGHWEWIAVGAAVFLAVAVIGAALDSSDDQHKD